MTPCILADSIKTNIHTAKDLPSRDALLIALHGQQQTIIDLQARLGEHAELIDDKDQTIENLQEKMRLAIAQRFGKSSEKTDPNQRELFNEARAARWHARRMR